MSQVDFDVELAQRTVLVVDDDDSIRVLLVDLFEQSDYRVLSARNAREGLDILAVESVGVAIVDKNMPGELDGIGMLQALPDLARHLKAIVLTAHASTESAVEALRLGAFDYETKPVSLDLIRSKVAKASEAFIRDFERDELLGQLSTLFDTIPSVIWFVTADGTFRQVNQTGAEILGYQPEDLAGKSYEMLLADGEDDPEVHWAFKERRTGTRATRRKAVELKTASGELRLFEIYSAGAYMLDTAGSDEKRRMWGTVGLAHDVTEYVRQEHAVQEANKMEALGRLAGGLAHDFNNILAVMINCADFALHVIPEDSEAREDLHQIMRAGQRAAELTGQMLAFSRKDVQTTRSVDLAQAIGDMAHMLDRLVGDTVQVVHEPVESLGTVQANPSQLQQVLLNLVANARDSMPDGGTIHLRLSKVEVDEAMARGRDYVKLGEYLRIEVADNGSGMPPEVRDKIFEPFFTTKQSGRGTGLGLSTVHGIVHQNKGFIDVESEEGRGTTVSVLLPRIADVSAQAAVSVRVGSGRGVGTVLLVEDDESLRALTVRGLAQAGYTVIDAPDAEEARAIYDAYEGRVDALVTDVLLPGKPGTKLAMELRDLQSDLVVVYVSGYVGSLGERYQMLEGKAAFLAKPHPIRQLVEKVGELLGQGDG